MYRKTPHLFSVLHDRIIFRVSSLLNDNDKANIFYLTISNNAHKRYTIFWINKLWLGLETIIKTQYFALS